MNLACNRFHHTNFSIITSLPVNILFKLKCFLCAKDYSKSMPLHRRFQFCFSCLCFSINKLTILGLQINPLRFRRFCRSKQNYNLLLLFVVVMVFVCCYCVCLLLLSFAVVVIVVAVVVVVCCCLLLLFVVIVIIVVIIIVITMFHI